MQISYKPLWHTLLEKGMSKEDLRTMAKLSTNAIANMGKNKNVSMSTLLKICETLQCDLNAVVELKGLDSVKESEETETQLEHKTYSPRLVSLFSGCGGMDKGFENAGYSRVWANDFDKDAQAVFRLNLGEIDGRDITTVPVDDIPDCDILTAGFPCQPFSNAGNRMGVYDERGELYLECLRIIEHKQPRAVLFENVKGLMSSKHQSGKKLIDVIKEDLERLGYFVNYKVVNASDYGVPQNRERMILVALRKDLGKTFEFPPIQSDKSKLTLRHMLLGGLFDSGEMCSSKGVMFPTAFRKLAFYQPGTEFNKIPGRMKDTVEKKNINVPIFNDVDSKLTLRSNYKDLIDEKYLKGQRISLSKLAAWTFRFSSFEFDSMPNEKQFSRVLDKAIKKYFKITKK